MHLELNTSNDSQENESFWQHTGFNKTERLAKTFFYDWDELISLIFSSGWMRENKHKIWLTLKNNLFY